MPQKKKSGKKNHHTLLFKKILSSFFATESMMQIGMNPASMFVSFVSSKQFFGLINRRMAEHYKLNLFDISLDSFDVRIGFGDDPTITVKNIDIYYAYNSSANFVGYKSYNPNIIATGLSLLFASQIVDLFEQEDDVYFNHFIFTIYFLVFVFIAKIKIFPEGSRQVQYDWFVKVFRSFYETIFENTGTVLEPDKFETIKALLLDDVKIFFSLFEIFKELAQYFYVVASNYRELLQRLFTGELQHKVHEVYTKQYLELHADLCQNTTFSVLERKIIDLIIPADILIRYLFGDDEGKFISKHILSSLYSPEHCTEILESCVVSGERVPEIIEYGIDFASLKKNFFFGLQNYIKAKITSFQDENPGNSVMDSPSEDDIDDFLSFLDEKDQIDIKALPGNIHLQTITLDKLINFYVSFVGGFWVAKGDSGYMRLHKGIVLRELLTQYPLLGSTHHSVHFYSKFFSLYEKNVFYYQYIFNHVRSGKDSFVLPTKASVISHQSNVFIVQLLNENFWAILLQDTYKSDVKLYIKKPEILEIFKNFFGKQITAFIHGDKNNIVEYMYKDYNYIGSGDGIFDIIYASISETEFALIKNRMYCLDFWIFETIKKKIIDSQFFLHYESPMLLSLFALLKETFFGFILYMQYIISSEDSHQKNYHSEKIVSIYCSVILQLSCSDSQLVSLMIHDILENYKEILALWILLDDNQDYMYIGFNNRSTWIEQQDLTLISDALSDEDIIWFMGYLKHMTYYNKRFLIPY